MTQQRWLAGALTFALAMVAAAALLLATDAPADGSALSRGSRGWLAARRYLEARGCRVTLLDRALGEAPHDGVLVLAFPWQAIGWDNLDDVLDRRLQAGGDVLFAYSGHVYEPWEEGVAGTLDLTWDASRGQPPLNPWRWREYANEEWSLVGEDTAREARIAAPRRFPRAPSNATVLARDPQGRAAAFLFTRRRGRVVVVPAEAFANSRLGNPGNADLLEELHARLGDTWSFDELHHGLRAPLTVEQQAPQQVLLLFLLQVVFIYALVAVALGRRFGPAWREPAAASGSTATFLVSLGVLHHRLGHHHEAAPLLLARARELDPRLTLEDEPAAGAAAFLALARRVGDLQSGRGRKA